MDIYDQGLTQQQAGNDLPDRTPTRRHETNDAATQPAQTQAQDHPQPSPSLEAEVTQLVSGISSWWSGVAQKSQASINQAKKHVDSQGGLFGFARAEYSKLEAQLADAQKRARDESFQPQISDVDATAAAAAAAAAADGESGQDPLTTGKGKQRAIEEEGAGEQADGSSPSTTGNEAGPLDAAAALFSRVTSQLTSDPRVAQLQTGLLAALPKSNPLVRTARTADGAEKPPATPVQDTLATLSRTIQSHLPHLDLGQSQQLASRYLEASENFAKDLGRDMRELAGELVRIVPPDEEAEGAAPLQSDAASSVDAASLASVATKSKLASERDAKEAGTTSPMPSPTTTGSITTSDTKGRQQPQQDEDEFVWDEEEELAEQETKGKGAPVNEAPSKSSEAQQAQQATAPEKEQAESSDSDWE